jgi:hypothetical protein
LRVRENKWQERTHFNSFLKRGDGSVAIRVSCELPSTTRELAVRGGLDVVQLRVLTFLGHQLLVRADLH